MNISFSQYQKGTKQTKLPVIRDLSLTVHQGEMVAVVGSSGSGKSLLAHGVMGILPYNAEMGGEILYCGEPLTEKKNLRSQRKEIVMVPQSTSYLDPLMKVGTQTLPWGLKLNMEGSAIGHSEQCYDGATCRQARCSTPTFLYEMIWNLIGAALIVFLGFQKS